MYDGIMSFVGRIEARADEAALPHILRSLWQEIFSDHATMIAAGLTYYAIFGLLPALAAAAALWSLVGDAGALKSALQDNGSMLPSAMVQLLLPFITSVPKGFGGGVALLVNLALVVWTATRASGGLLTALNVVYDVKETRGQVYRWTAALVLGVSGIALLFSAIALLALVPLVASWFGGQTSTWLLFLRWPGLVMMFAAVLAMLFRYGPSRPDSRTIPLCWGVAVGTVLCLLASAGISLYVGHLANFGRLYGSLGSIAVALLWLYGCSIALLIGAEIDAVLTSRLDGALQEANYATESRTTASD